MLIEQSILSHSRQIRRQSVVKSSHKNKRKNMIKHNKNFNIKNETFSPHESNNIQSSILAFSDQSILYESNMHRKVT